MALILEFGTVIMNVVLGWTDLELHCVVCAAVSTAPTSTTVATAIVPSIPATGTTTAMANASGTTAAVTAAVRASGATHCF